MIEHVEAHFSRLLSHVQVDTAAGQLPDAFELDERSSRDVSDDVSTARVGPSGAAVPFSSQRTRTRGCVATSSSAGPPDTGHRPPPDLLVPKHRRGPWILGTSLCVCTVLGVVRTRRSGSLPHAPPPSTPLSGMVRRLCPVLHSCAKRPPLGEADHAENAPESRHQPDERIRTVL